MPPPDVSVVVPTLDGALRLPETLASLAGQTVEGQVEVIVVDDGSSDGSAGVAEAARMPWGPVQVVRHEAPRGRAEACNSGLAAAHGAIVVILDDDMTLGTGALEAHRRFHRDHPRTGAVARVDLDVQGSEDSAFTRFLLREDANRARQLAASADAIPFPLCLTGHFSAPRDVLRGIGGFDTRIRLYGLEDIELAYRLGRAGIRIAYLAQAAALHRDHANTLDRYLARHEHVGVVARQLATWYPEGPFRRFLRVDAPESLGIGRDRAGLVALRLSNRLLLSAPVRRALASRRGGGALRLAIRTFERLGLDRAAHFATHVARDVRYFHGYFGRGDVAATTHADATAAGDRKLEGRRIAVVLEDLRLGGAERQALILARDLRAQGAHVEIWGLGAPAPAGPVEEAMKGTGIVCRPLGLQVGGGAWRAAKAILRMAREVRRRSVEAVLPYTLVPNVVCSAAGPLSGARVWFWNQRDAGVGAVGRRLERWSARHARAVVSNSRAGSAYLTTVLGVDPARVRLVPNGVDMAPPRATRAEWRERLGLGEDIVAFVMLANLHANKDHDTLLRAMARPGGTGSGSAPPPHLLLAGRLGETYPALAELAKDLAIDDRVHFLGPVADVAGLLLACDAGVLSSRAEGCPNAVLECMAAGLCVVGTDIVGIRDLLGAEGSELLAPAGDAGALAECLRRAASDRALRSRLGHANRRRAVEAFGADRMCRTMTEMILEGLGA